MVNIVDRKRERGESVKMGEEREEDRSGGCMHGGEERSPVAKNPKNICTVKMKG